VASRRLPRLWLHGSSACRKMHKAHVLVFVFGQDFLSVTNNFDDTFVACCSCILRVPSCRTSMAGPLGRGARDLGAPANNAENINGEPSWGAMWEIRQRTPLMIKTSMVGPLGGDAEDLAAPTINTKKCGPTGRRCQRSGSVHHQR
jgi:hypothetical protein